MFFEDWVAVFTFLKKHNFFQTFMAGFRRIHTLEESVKVAAFVCSIKSKVPEINRTRNLEEKLTQSGQE